MSNSEVRLNEWISAGFNLYKANLGVLILGALLTALISVVTVGLLAGPMMAGLVYVVLGILDGRQPKPGGGDVFKGFNYFVQAFLFAVVWGLILIVGSVILNVVPLLGQLASLAFSLGLQALLMFAIFLIVDEGMDFWSASMASIEKVRSNLWPFIGLGVVSMILGGLGAIACGIGVIFTLPIQVCIVAVAYREVFGGAVPVSETRSGGYYTGSPSQGGLDDDSQPGI